MANEQTSVPLFVADTILTAAQQNISAGTGVPVFATTVTRDAAFGGANKALAEGQLCYLSATNVVQYYDGAAWATVGPAAAATSGLTYVGGASPSAAATVSIDNVFSATYENYLIKYNLTFSASSGTRIQLRVGGVTTVGTGYNSSFFYSLMTSAATGNVVTGAAAHWLPSQSGQVSRGTIEIYQPFTAVQTSITFEGITEDGTYNMSGGGQHTGVTSFDGLHFSLSTGTITGTIRIYGRSNS